MLDGLKGVLSVKRYSLILCTFIWVGAGLSVFAQDVDFTKDIDLSRCNNYAWFQHEKIPIFDPMYTPDQPEIKQTLEEIDTELREAVDKKLAKRGWNKVSDSGASCRLRYALLQEIDLEIAPHGENQINPTATDGLGEGLGRGFASDVKRRGTLTLEVLPSDSEAWLWRGLMEGTLGKPKDIRKKARNWAEKIAEKIPSLR